MGPGRIGPRLAFRPDARLPTGGQTRDVSGVRPGAAAQTERRQDMSTPSHPKRLRLLLGLIQAGVGLSAILGGAQLVSDPTGAGAALPLEWLQGSPFSDYLIPGLLLLVAVGLGTSLAAGATWLGFRRAGLLAMAAGLVLVVFILTEVWMVGWRTLLQPLFLVLGLLILALGLAAQRQTLPAALRPGPFPSAEHGGPRRGAVADAVRPSNPPGRPA
jgi:hypothetical protein